MSSICFIYWFFLFRRRIIFLPPFCIIFYLLFHCRVRCRVRCRFIYNRWFGVIYFRWFGVIYNRWFRFIYNRWFRFRLRCWGFLIIIFSIWFRSSNSSGSAWARFKERAFLVWYIWWWVSIWWLILGYRWIEWLVINWINRWIIDTVE